MAPQSQFQAPVLQSTLPASRRQPEGPQENTVSPRSQYEGQRRWTHVVEIVQQLLRRLPAHARISDADAALEALAAVRRLLSAFSQIGLDHDAHDALLAGAKLLANIRDDLFVVTNAESAPSAVTSSDEVHTLGWLR